MKWSGVEWSGVEWRGGEGRGGKGREGVRRTASACMLESKEELATRRYPGVGGV